MGIDLFPIARGGHTGHWIDVSTQIEETGRQKNQPDIGLEVDSVNFVEPQQVVLVWMDISGLGVLAHTDDDDKTVAAV